MRGVYTITHMVSGMVYVGSSSNIGHRWGYHRSALKRSKHENERLQALYNADGIEGFTFSIVAVIDSGDMLQTEQAYIDLYSISGRIMNLYKVAGSPKGYKHSEETRQKISNGIKRRSPPSLETRRKLSLSKMGNPGRPSIGKERRSLSDDRAAKVKQMLSDGMYPTEIERLTGIKRYTVRRIAAGLMYIDVAPHLNQSIAQHRTDGRSCR